MGDDLDSSVTSLIRLVRGLGRTADILYVGAHPDDEDSALIAMLAQGDSGRVVCWSATRGEGGQNRVTSYAGSELGVYRTWESMRARTIDGGESWFGPFYDYDYSKSGAETLEKWGKDRLVAEIVRAIRAAPGADHDLRLRGAAITPTGMDITRRSGSPCTRHSSPRVTQPGSPSLKGWVLEPGKPASSMSACEATGHPAKRSSWESAAPSLRCPDASG